VVGRKSNGSCESFRHQKADIICVTHDHSDHLGDAFNICKRTGATFVNVYELSVYAQEKGVKELWELTSAELLT
jgi:L-ascorbate metabolism protein UlaG (beta-lactamase superfamily)